jgi:hypothetical protein
MALTTIQRHVCRLLAEDRRRSGESYVAGGVALAVALRTGRVSRDLDLFHDTEEAVARSWDRDRAILEEAGFRVRALRERPAYVEAEVAGDRDILLVEWTRDSAFRFFPLVEHDALGLALHPFDLATNKVLALVGRLEVRDWIDVIACHEGMQPLGYLAWAACGKDPGFTPSGILAQARRSSRYTDADVSSLAFDGVRPTASDLSRRWHSALEAAVRIVGAIPAEHVGEAVLTSTGDLFTGTVHALDEALRLGNVEFHRGRIGGAWPQIKG